MTCNVNHFLNPSQNSANRFMVGDVKQSIYSFRQAMPDIFIRYKDKFPRYDRRKGRIPGIYRVRPQLPFAAKP